MKKVIFGFAFLAVFSFFVGQIEVHNAASASPPVGDVGINVASAAPPVGDAPTLGV